MIEYETEIVTKHGLMPSFAVHPDPRLEGPYPAVIFYMDAPGIREELRDMARRIAKAGYFVVVPDMYYRLGTIRFDHKRRDDSMSAVVGACLRSLDNTKVIEDTAGILNFIEAHDAARSGPVSSVGFCMSGRYMVAVMAYFGDRMTSGASLYGVGMVTEDEGSPHKLVANVTGEMYFAFAETDTSAPPETIKTLEQSLIEAGRSYAIDVFPGTNHGYAFAAGRAYEPKGAEATWAKLFDLWERTLK